MTHVERRQRRRLIADAVCAGASLSEVATQFGVGIHLVSDSCAEHNVRPGNHGLRPSSYAIIANLIVSDAPLVAIAESFGVTKQRVSQIYGECVRAGIPVHERRKGRKRG